MHRFGLLNVLALKAFPGSIQVQHLYLALTSRFVLLFKDNQRIAYLPLPFFPLSLSVSVSLYPCLGLPVCLSVSLSLSIYLPVSLTHRQIHTETQTPTQTYNQQTYLLR